MTPQQHRDKAVAILTDAQTTEPPSEARVLTQAAIAHALLGLLEVQIGKQAPLCWNCNKPMRQDSRGVWWHNSTGLQVCYDAFKPEIATPTERNAAHGS